MKRFGAVLILLTWFSSFASAQNCDQLILHGLRNISVTKSANAAIATKYFSYCGSDYDKLDKSLQGSVDVDVIGYGSGGAELTTTEKREKLRSWCDQNRSLAQSNAELYEESRMIFQGALDAWSKCNELASNNVLQHSFFISDDQKTVAISLQAGVGSLGVPYIGTKASGFACTEEKWTEQGGSEPIHTGKGTVIKGFAVKIHCDRKVTKVASDRTRLERGLITVQTGQLKDVSLFFPEEVIPPFDEKTREDIINRISSLCIGCIQSSLLPEDKFQAANGKGWVLCNGQSVENSKYHKITGDKKAPNLQGVFLRGKNNGRFTNIDETNLGDYQSDELMSHSHTVIDPGHQHEIMTAQPPGTVDGGLQFQGRGIVGKDKLVRGTTTGISMDSFGGKETRPKNITINYFLKVD